jgi:hypothetical protein
MRTSMTVASMMVLAALALGGCAGEIGGEESTGATRAELSAGVDPFAQPQLPPERIVSKERGIEDLSAPSRAAPRLDATRIGVHTARPVSPDGMEDRMEHYREAQGEIGKVVTFGGELAPKEALVAHGMERHDP